MSVSVCLSVCLSVCVWQQDNSTSGWQVSMRFFSAWMAFLSRCTWLLMKVIRDHSEGSVMLTVIRMMLFFPRDDSRLCPVPQRPSKNEPLDIDIAILLQAGCLSRRQANSSKHWRKRYHLLRGICSTEFSSVFLYKLQRYHFPAFGTDIRRIFSAILLHMRSQEQLTVEIRWFCTYVWLVL